MQESKCWSVYFIYFFVLFQFIISSIFAFTYGSTRKPIENCTTKGCIITVGTMFDNIDDTIDPCENFYQYACNNYITNILPDPDELYFNLERQRYYEYLAELKVLLDAPKDLSEEESIRKAKDIYYACMNSTDADQIHSIKLFLEDFGGWPLVEGIFWDKRYFNWLGMNYQLIKHGLWMASIITVDTEDTEDELVQIKIKPNDMKAIQKIFSETFNKSKKGNRERIIEIFEKIIEILGGYGNKSVEIIELLDLGENILQILSQNREDEVSYVNITFLENLAPELKWRNFLEEIFQVKVTDEIEILIRSPKVFKEIVTFLDTTEKRKVANFMFFCLLVNIYEENYLTPEIGQHIRHGVLNFHETYEKRESPAEYCIKISYQALPETVQKMHAKKYFTLRDIYKLQTMEASIKNAFINHVVDGKFLEEGMKAKISTMMQAENSIDGFSVLSEEFYRHLEDTTECLVPSRRDHFANMVSVGERNSNRLLRKIKHKATSPSSEEMLLRWNLDSQVRFINLSNNNQTLLQIPQHFLRGLYYSEDRPLYLNYGFLGFYIARSLYSSLQSDPDAASLYKTDQCLTSELSGSLRNDMKQVLNNENIRNITLDILGLQLSYAVYRSSIDEGDEEPVLPGLNLTDRQLFWLSYATSLCTVYDIDEITALPSSITFDETRVIHSLRNSEQFAKDFNCPRTSYMNPDYARKCKIP